MGKGGYNGGSTIIGPGGGWSFDPAADTGRTEPTRTKSEPGLFVPLPRLKRKNKKKHKKQKVVVARVEVSKSVLHQHRIAREQGLDRDAILDDLGFALPDNPLMRQVELKMLVAAGILLPTGAINVNHAEVAAWLNTNGKKK